MGMGNFQVGMKWEAAAHPRFLDRQSPGEKETGNSGMQDGSQESTMPERKEPHDGT